jgi:hypothetical protein
MDEYIQVAKQERMDSEMADEEIQVKFMVETRPDDPFIIIRKESIKKSNPLPMQTPRQSRLRTSRRKKTQRARNLMTLRRIRIIKTKLKITLSQEEEAKIQRCPR